MASTKFKFKLTPEQELFCQYYTSSDSELFGNGVQSYLEAYKPDRTAKNWYNSACADASRLLSKAKIFDRINNLLHEQGLNDAFADKQLLFLLSQHEDKNSKLGAIREYNKLKSRITDKVDLTSGGKPIASILSGVKQNDQK